MTAVSVLLLALLGADVPLDDFSQPAADAAASPWKPDGATPPLKAVDGPDGPYLELRAPFATALDMERAVIDRQVDLDLSAYRDFDLRLAVDDPRGVANLTLYFRSGAGWLGCSGSLAKPGWQTVRFSRESFRSEGTPTGWHQIDGIRLAAWRAADVNATLQLDRLAAVVHEIAIIVPESGGDGEARAGRAAAARISGMLAAMGLGCDRIDQSELEAETGQPLGERRIAILPYNPTLNDRGAERLEQFVIQGGRLFVCYSLPPRLADLLGIKSLRHLPGERDGQFAEIRFDASDITGLPKAARQASWNIHTAEPSAHNARVIGQWYDDAGQPTGQPALLASDRGAYLTHVLLDDDPQAKQQLLAAVLGHLWPTLWEQMAAAAAERAVRIGHCASLKELDSVVRTTGQAAAIELLDEGLQLRAQADEQTAQQDSDAEQAGAAQAAAVQLYAASRERLVQAYLLAQPSPAREGRAVWNHSGMGAWPGDWERSAAVLADNGFNIVLPNLLWGGLAHYPSEILPRSSSFERYGDQVQQCVEAAHRHGIEVHVWKVNYNLSNAPQSLRAELRRAGRTQVSAGGQPHDWLCPSHPENLRMEVDSLLEVARKYDIDGLHFDYIRYPDGNHCYCDGCRERFSADSGRTVENWPADCHRGELRDAYRRWRCEQITRLVETVHREAKQLRPELKISAAVFGSYPSCRDSVGQDWPQWVQAGLLDFICPMDYTESDAAFSGLVEKQLQLIGRRIPMYPGIGASASNSKLTPDRVVGQIHHARRLGAGGFTIFNFSPSLAEEIVPAVGVSAGATKAKP